jgi:hypothetical protein
VREEETHSEIVQSHSLGGEGLSSKCAGSKEGSKGQQRRSDQQDQRTDLEV